MEYIPKHSPFSILCPVQFRQYCNIRRGGQADSPVVLQHTPVTTPAGTNHLLTNRTLSRVMLQLFLFKAHFRSLRTQESQLGPLSCSSWRLTVGIDLSVQDQAILPWSCSIPQSQPQQGLTTSQPTSPSAGSCFSEYGLRWGLTQWVLGQVQPSSQLYAFISSYWNNWFSNINTCTLT